MRTQLKVTTQEAVSSRARQLERAGTKHLAAVHAGPAGLAIIARGRAELWSAEESRADGGRTKDEKYICR